MSHPLEHISKLKPFESRGVLERGLREKLIVACSMNEEIKVYDLSFYGELKNDRIIFNSKRWLELKNKTCAFSMKVETQVYFFKTKVYADDGEVYLKMDFDIFELKRRRDIRYMVPYEWPQSAAIVLGSKKDKKMAANIMDLSVSGIKLQLLAQVPEIKIGQKIAFTIKIHRRSIAYLNGTVRHSRRMKNQLPLIGVEINVTSALLKDKLSNVCSDIVRFALLSKKKHK